MSYYENDEKYDFTIDEHPEIDFYKRLDFINEIFTPIIDDN